MIYTCSDEVNFSLFLLEGLLSTKGLILCHSARCRERDSIDRNSFLFLLSCKCGFVSRVRDCVMLKESSVKIFVQFGKFIEIVIDIFWLLFQNVCTLLQYRADSQLLQFHDLILHKANALLLKSIWTKDWFWQHHDFWNQSHAFYILQWRLHFHGRCK